VELELLAPRAGATATGKVLVPPARARFGVISDIDDTVVQSHVTRKLRMVVGLALSNARTRKPFEGVAAFYRALHEGAGGEGNPNEDYDQDSMAGSGAEPDGALRPGEAAGAAADEACEALTDIPGVSAAMAGRAVRSLTTTCSATNCRRTLDRT